jgi:hypothetical protein
MPLHLHLECQSRTIRQSALQEHLNADMHVPGTPRITWENSDEYMQIFVSLLQLACTSHINHPLYGSNMGRGSRCEAVFDRRNVNFLTLASKLHIHGRTVEDKPC